VSSGRWIAGLVRRRIVGQHLQGYGIEPGSGDDISSEWLTNNFASAQAGRGQRIVDHDEPSLAVERLREITAPLQFRWHRRTQRLREFLSEAFIGGKEEGAILPYRPASDDPELIAAEVDRRSSGTVREKIVGVEGTVAMEFVGGAAEIVRPGLRHDGHHSARR